MSYWHSGSNEHVTRMDWPRMSQPDVVTHLQALKILDPSWLDVYGFCFV
jgi:hypothetical protein